MGGSGQVGRLTMIGEVVRRANCEHHQVPYQIRKLHLEPVHWAGYARVFPEADAKRVVDQILALRLQRDERLADEVDAAWAFLQPILEGCAAYPVRDLPTYAAGSWGPKEADDLIEADGRRWLLVRRPPSRTGA